MQVRILRPAKSVMQSSHAEPFWHIEPELPGARAPEPLMGWASAEDTLSTLHRRLRFNTRDEAVTFATRMGWGYSVEEPKDRVLAPKNYLDNFRWTPPEEQAG